MAQDITERLGLIESLRVARNRSRKYFELAGLIYLVLTPNGEVMDINQTGCQMLGYSKDEVVGQKWSERFVPEQFRDRLKQVFKSLLADSGEYAQFESPVTTKDGRQLTMLWHNSVLRDDDGQILAMLSAGTDITSRLEAEEAIRWQSEVGQHLSRLAVELSASVDFNHAFESLLRAGALLTNSDLMLLGQVNAEKGIVTYGHEWPSQPPSGLLTKLTGLPMDQMPWSGGYALRGEIAKVDDVDRDMPPEALETKLTKGAGVKSLMLAPLPTGGTIPLGVLIFARTKAGRPGWSNRDLETARMIVGLTASAMVRYQDVAKLAESERRLAQITSDASIGVFQISLGPPLEIKQANQAMLDILEANSFEELSTAPSERLLGNAAAVVETFVREIAERGEIRNKTIEIKTLKGRTITLEFSIQAKTDADGRPSIEGVAEDISDRVEADRRVKELNSLKSTFIQVASHQIRTPLNSIRWSLETLLSEDLGKLTPSQKDFLRVVYKAESEILDRLNEMLTALDIEEGRIVFQKGSFSLDSVWSSVMAEATRRCRIKDIAFKYHADQGPFMIDGDAEKIRAVMSHLAENAVGYTSSGGHIEVTISRRDSRIRFEIKDSGIGIPDSEKKRIFNRFYRATNAPLARPDATGLGLAISKYYVEQHQGQIGFASQEGQGSTFWFELPAAQG